MNNFKNNMARKFDLIRKLNTSIKNRHLLSLLDLKIGSFLKIQNVLYYIDDIYTYFEKDSSWNEFKLIDIKTLDIAFIEIEEDDDIIIHFSKNKVPMRKLPSPDDIEEMSEEESGSILLDNKMFYYDDDYKAKFKRNDSDKKDKVYFYEFVSDDGELLSIEEWKDGDNYSYEAWLSSQINKLDIDILQI